MSASRESKQSTLVTVVALVVVAVVVGGAGYLIYLGVRDAPSVVGALVTALGAVLAVVAGRIYETRTAIEQARRERMAPIYERLIETFYAGASGKEATEDEMQEFFEQLAQRLLIWGPTPVVRAFTTWKDEVHVHEGSLEALFHFERLIAAMRRDLGTKSSDLAPGDLLRVFINDLDEHQSGQQQDG